MHYFETHSRLPLLPDGFHRDGEVFQSRVSDWVPGLSVDEMKKWISIFGYSVSAVAVAATAP